MPGRHGKQRTKKKRSRREKQGAMEKMVVDSYFTRQRKETEILTPMLPKKPQLMKPRLAVPMITLPTPGANVDDGEVAVALHAEKKSMKLNFASKSDREEAAADKGMDLAVASGEDKKELKKTAHSNKKGGAAKKRRK